MSNVIHSKELLLSLFMSQLKFAVFFFAFLLLFIFLILFWREFYHCKLIYVFLLVLSINTDFFFREKNNLYIFGVDDIKNKII